MFHDRLFRRVAKIGLIPLDALKKVCTTKLFHDAICNACDHIMPCVFLSSCNQQHSQHPDNFKIRNLKTKWEVTQKVQLLKAQITDKSSR